MEINGCTIGTRPATATIADGSITVEGDSTVVLTLVGIMAEPDPAPNIATP